jgi:hypothetical protein
MSQLLWGTLLLGLLVLAGVAAYSWWDMRRTRKKLIGTVPKAGKPRGEGLTYVADRDEPGGDTTIMDTRIEPRLHDDDQRSDNATGTVDAIDVPAYERLRGQSAERLMDEATTALAPMATNAASTAADEAAIVSTAFIEYASPVSGHALLQHLPGSRRAGSKPVDVLANVGNDDAWQPVNAQAQYRAVRLDVLLANRQGPLNEMDYSEFAAMVQRLADATEGEADFDDMQESVKRARELDEFAANHDAMITLALRAKGSAWSAGFLQQTASSLGFVAGQVPGRMVKQHASGEVLVALQFDTQAAMATADDAHQHALTQAALVLDVPQAQRIHAPLAVLKDSACSLAKALDAAITDEQGRGINDDTWMSLSTQLAGLYDALEHQGLAAGSAAARRVYS